MYRHLRPDARMLEIANCAFAPTARPLNLSSGIIFLHDPGFLQASETWSSKPTYVYKWILSRTSRKTLYVKVRQVSHNIRAYAVTATVLAYRKHYVH